MQQLDLFTSSKEDFLYSEMQKIRTSMDKRTKSIFALISELQEQLLQLREKEEK